MMREPFDNTVDIFKGPGAANPGLFVGTFPCRLVAEDAIETIGAGAPTVPAYMTIEEYVPDGCWTFPTFGMDSDLADRAVIPSGGSTEYVVLLVDAISWKSQPTYYRAYLCDPEPSPAFEGGLLIGGVGDVTARAFIQGIGGLLLGGSASTRPAPAGGLLLGGSASTRPAPAGGLLLGGSASTRPAPAGGLLVGGEATVTTWRIWDKFNVSDQTNAGRTPDTADGPGTTWSNTLGTSSVVSNTLQGTSFSGNLAHSVIDNLIRASTINVSVTLPNSSALAVMDLLFRFSDDSNFWYGQFSYQSGDSFGINNKLYIVEFLAGVPTIYGPVTASITHSTPYDVVLTDDGTNIAMTVNGTTINVSSTSGNTRTKAGCGFYSSDNSATVLYDFIRIQ